MNISMRSAIGLVTSAVLAVGLVTGTALATAAPNDDPGPRRSSQESTLTAEAALAATGAGSETLFVPLVPCRIVDTRAVGGKLGPAATRSFYVSGTAGFTGQGGKSGGCGIPLGATAVALSLTSTQSTSNGRLLAYPAGTPAPASTMLSFTASANATSTPTVALTPGDARQMTVRNYVGSTHFVIDVLGYYVPQMSAYIGPDAALYVGSRVVETSRIDVGEFAVEFDTDITSCNGVGSAGDTAHIVSVYPWENIAYVYIFDAAGAPVDSFANIVIVC